MELFCLLKNEMIKTKVLLNLCLDQMEKINNFEHLKIEKTRHWKY